MPNARQSGPRAFCSQFLIQVGPISTTGRLLPLIDTESRTATQFPTICPSCEEPRRCTQGYSCTEGHGPFTIGELHRSRELVDGCLVRVTQEEYDAAREVTTPRNVFSASIHPAEGVHLYDGDSVYIFEPAANTEYHGMLLRLVNDANKVFLSVVNLRGYESLFRLGVWEGNLILQRVLWPEQLNHFDTPENTCDDALFNAAVGMLDRIVSDFDAEKYRNQFAERVRALTDSLVGVEDRPAALQSEVAEQTRTDILEVLNAFAA